MTRTRRLAGAGLVVLALVWTGVLLGAAFLAAPAPFMAESVDRAAALDVNRHLFRALSRAETVLLLLTLVAGLLLRPRGLVLAGLALLATAVLVESLWLLPALDARATLIQTGREPPPAPYHALYTGLEVVKLVLLPALAWRATRLLTDPPRGRAEKTMLAGTRSATGR